MSTGGGVSWTPRRLFHQEPLQEGTCPRKNAPAKTLFSFPDSEWSKLMPLDKRLDDDIKQTLIATQQGLKERASQKYDGVVGTLPDWMPPDFHLQFEDARNQLLTQLSHAEVFSYLKEYGKYLKPKYDGRPRFPIAYTKLIGTLHYIQKAVSLDETKGLGWLVGSIAAGKIEKGRKYSTHQSNIAKRPRGKVGDNGENIEDIIENLTGNEEATAQDLWGHFHSALDDHQLNPEETPHKTDSAKSTITYDFKDGRKSITFGRFATVLSQLRKRKGKSR